MGVVSKSNRTIITINTSFKLIPLFVFLISFLNFTLESSDGPTFLRENCTTTQIFTPNTTFQFNLKTLLASLSSNAAGNTQFYNTTVSTSGGGDAVYGLFMCRGDVPPRLCQDCVYNATRRLGGTDTCPFSKGAIIWYDECMVRYSHTNFLSKMETRPRMRLRNTGNVTDTTKGKFMGLLYSTLNETADEAAKTTRYYATKQAKLSAFQTLYCLTQCTPDLSAQDCRKCLGVVIEDVAWCCTYRVGGRVLYPSCNFRKKWDLIRDNCCNCGSDYSSCAAVYCGLVFLK